MELNFTGITVEGVSDMHEILLDRLGSISGPCKELDALVIAWLFEISYHRVRHGQAKKELRWSPVESKTSDLNADTDPSGKKFFISIWSAGEFSPISTLEVPALTSSVDEVAKLIKREFGSSSWTLQYYGDGRLSPYLGTIQYYRRESVAAAARQAAVALLKAIVLARAEIEERMFEQRAL